MRALGGLAALLLLAGAAPAQSPSPKATPPRPGSGLAGLSPCPHGPETWTPVGALQAPLEAGRWDEVERALVAAHTEFEKDHRCEQRMLRPFLAGFWGTIDDLRKGFDRWVAARPDSWTARTLRGVFWVQEAYRRRGGGAGWQIDEAERRGMNEAIELALPDLERAIALHPAAVVAHGGVIDAHRMFGQTDAALAAWKRGRAADPLSVYLRERTIQAVQPWWGGSLELVREIVADARGFEEKNPHLMRIRGYTAATQAGLLANGLRDDDTPNRRSRIVGLYTSALRYGEVTSDWHLHRVATYVDGGSYELGLRDATYAVEANPELLWFQDWRIRALLGLQRHEEALAAAREAQKHLPGEHRMVWWEGHALTQLHRWEESASAYRRAVDCCAAGESDRLRMLASLANAARHAGRHADAEAAAREALALDSEDTGAWRELGLALRAQGRREEAEAAFEHAPELDAPPPADAE